MQLSILAAIRRLVGTINKKRNAVLMFATLQTKDSFSVYIELYEYRNFLLSFWYLCMKYYESYPNLSLQFFLTETYAQLTIDPAVKYQ